MGKTSETNEMRDTTAPLTGDDAAAVTQAVEDNMAAAHISTARRLGGTIHDSSDLLWALTNTGILPFNTIIRTRWPDEPPEALRERIAATLAPYRAAGRAALWWRWPSSRPATLGDALVDYGLRFRGEGPGMATLLRDLPALATLPLPNDLTLDEVSDMDSMRDWLDVSMLVYRGAEKPATPEEHAAEARIGIGAQLPSRRWLARLAGVPVGTASIFLGAGVVGIYNVTTLPEARGQGIGTAVTLAALAAARDAGYHVAVLQSSPMGFPVYTRLGFREVCRIQSYVWAP